MKVIVYNDFKTTGKCRLFIAKEKFSPNICSFATGKSDPMAKILSDECDHIKLKINRLNTILIFHYYNLTYIIILLAINIYKFNIFDIKANMAESDGPTGSLE